MHRHGVSDLLNCFKNSIFDFLIFKILIAPSSHAKYKNFSTYWEFQIAPPGHKYFDFGLFEFKSHSMTMPFSPVETILLFL
jgi:hypothetical protein